MIKRGKLILAFALSIIMLFAFAACDVKDSIAGEIIKSDEKSAEQTLESFFTALVNKDKQAAAACLTTDLENENNDEAENKIDPAAEAIKECFLESFEYEINECKKLDKQTVSAAVSINTVDMEEILPQYLQYAIELSSTAQFDDQLTADSLQVALKSYMESLLTSENTGRREVDIDVRVIKRDGSWLIDADEEFFDAITGGMITAGNELNANDY